MMTRVRHRNNRKPGVRPVLLFLGALFLLGSVVGQAEESPGSYVGEETCLACHEEIAGVAYERTAHGHAGLEGWDGAPSCEACHGPGGDHADSGEPEEILNPAMLPADEASENCLDCHGGDVAAHWAGSTHEGFDVTCTSCHRVHSVWTNDKALANKQVIEACLSCHKDKRKHLYQRSAHPLQNGLMSCADCHDSHGSMAEAAVSALTPNDKCYECHADKRGPYLFEHTPVREDCQTCHDPHGSNQTMLLHTSAPRLCQSCHLFGHHQTVPGSSGQVWNQNRSCLNCHPRIHGSNHPSGVIFMR